MITDNEQVAANIAAVFGLIAGPILAIWTTMTALDIAWRWALIFTAP